jgi:hypothetical protein
MTSEVQASSALLCSWMHVHLAEQNRAEVQEVMWAIMMDFSGKEALK